MNLEMYLKNCAYCGQSSSLLCQRCYGSYCSTNCQMLDWPRHKYFCRPVPHLIPNPKLPSTKNNSNFETVSINNLSQLVMEKCRQAHYSNLNQSRNEPEKVNFDTTRSSHSENEKHLAIERKTNQSLTPVRSTGAQNKNYNEKNLCTSKLRAPKVNHTSDAFQLPIGLNLLDINETREKSCAATNIAGEIKNDEKLLDSKKIKEKYAWETPFQMPKEKFFDATVQYYDLKRKIAWVTDSSLLKYQIRLLRQINQNLNTMADAAKNNILKGSLYAAEFEDLFYRAVCLAEINSANKVKLRLIDYGNVFLADPYKLKLPTEFMLNLPSYAFRIYYPKKLDIEEKIKIQIFNEIVNPVLGKIYIVKQEDENGKAVLIQPALDLSLPNCSLLDCSLPKDFDVIFINFIDKKIKNTGILRIVQNVIQIELDNMNNILNSEKNFNYDLICAPKKGDFVAGRCGKFWKRGIVLGKHEKEFLVFFSDFGEIEFVQQVKQIPSDYRNLPHQIALININKILIDEKQFFNTRFTVDTKLKIRNFISQDSTLKSYLFDEDDNLADVTLKNFEENLIKLMQNNLWYINKFPHLSIVRITNVIDHCTIYIGIDSICDSYRLKINAIGKQLEEEFKSLEQNPEFHINEIVLVKQDTLEYIRCRISNLKNEDCIVEDIDTGKIFGVKIDAIFAANDMLKLMPVASAKYTLSILDKIEPCDAKLNKGLHQLKLYCEESKRFILKIGNCIEEGIVLSPVDDDKQSINTSLIPLLFQKINSQK